MTRSFPDGDARVVGGPELTSCQQTEVIEILATGDASAAMIGMDAGIYSGHLNQDVAAQMFP